MPEKGPISPHSILRELSHFVVSKFSEGDYDNSEELFALIEKMIMDGNNEVQNAATTCFLENLQNRSSSEDYEFDGSHFVSLLGPKSTEYCKAYDKITGIKTEGLT